MYWYALMFAICKNAYTYAHTYYMQTIMVQYSILHVLTVCYFEMNLIHSSIIIKYKL